MVAATFIDPSNRSAYHVALHMAVRAKVYSALLKTDDVLLQSVLDKNLSLPKMILKPSETFGDNTNHSLADMLPKIMTSDNLPAAWAYAAQNLQHLLLIYRSFKNW